MASRYDRGHIDRLAAAARSAASVVKRQDGIAPCLVATVFGIAGIFIGINWEALSELFAKALS
jgi:hypothetical protein